MDHPETPVENVSCEVYVATDAVSEVREALKELRGRGEKHPLRATDDGRVGFNEWVAGVFLGGWYPLVGLKRNQEETESRYPLLGWF